MATIENYEFRGTVANRLRAEGRLEGLRTAILTLFSARGVPLSEQGRAKLDACTDPNQLERWCARTSTAQTEQDVFND